VRARLATLKLLAAGAAAILLSACYDTPQNADAGLAPAGVLPAFVKDLRTIYVADYGKNNAIDVVKYGSWREIATITDGVNLPDDVWVDLKGNIYAANRSGPNVTEYSDAGKPVFTYSSGLSSPYSVTTDASGNVYVGDAGIITEYPQGSNSAIKTCAVPGLTTLGVAVDRHGNVFGDFYSGHGGILEYRNGLTGSGCKDRVLPITLGVGVGMAFDRQGNLVVADDENRRVDIIAPPFKSITGTLGSGWDEPNAVSIDQAGTQAYVTDMGTATVSVLSYPTGSVVTTLGSSNGLSQPFAAVDSKNYVP
jgi:DNA-binding beta-propeller fold protein YncE